jgi:hypothetical protein
MFWNSYLHLNADAVDDWMVPFVTLIAVMWGTLVFGIRYLPACYRAVKRRWSPRIRFRNGEHFTPRGGALFTNDAECPICLDTLRGCEVRAEQLYDCADGCPLG